MLINNHLNEEQIAQCVDAIISGNYGTLDSSLRNHLANCDECAAEVLNVTDIAIDLQAETPKNKTVNFKPWVIGVSSVAAGLLIFFAITTLFNEYSNNGKFAVDTVEKIVLPEKNDSIKQNVVSPNDENILAEASTPENKNNKPLEEPIQKTVETNTPQVKSNESSGAYTPDETLEMLFQNFTQAYRGEDIIVLSKGIIDLSKNDSLKWSNPSKEELYIEFFNNEGNRFLTLTERTSGVKIPDLENGLYYWKLINKDFDLLFVGKIIVE